ncbi:squalene/phytoene synthase family protein [Commensalibacter oyaizuii]|uniref:Squalene/phytoene synthase family protein n=1 Tax=Commensalibacter oyaizuii TaxID=3043873 RepID=A0ABT6Q300_9PROT|nr:squalene/phytoene synthase family protein [Commensalibacter sp. TBRC 16381]MDI2091498.1 squalene/phytoene synthase family protein [Commensalibacter sp. TBRC 16381]
MPNQNTSSLLSFCAQYVQKNDPDRFFCTLFIPPPHRELVFRLTAFYIEITRAVALPASWSVAGPMAGFIRLQWWRELIEGKDRTHEIAPFIRESIAQKTLNPSVLLSMIEAREIELDGIKDWEHWDHMMMLSSGALQQTIASILGIQDKAQLYAVGALGVAYDIVRMARYLPQMLQIGRCPFPTETIENLHLIRTDDGIVSNAEIVAQIRMLLIEKVHIYLDAGKKVKALGRKKNAAILPITLAKRDLKRSILWDHIPAKRGIGDQLAVVWSKFTGRSYI